MNIFVVQENPRRAARDLCDQHVVSQTKETAQLLSTYAHAVGMEVDELYRPSYINHPCQRWLRESEYNVVWLIEHGLGLAGEYTRRYERRHASVGVIHTFSVRFALTVGKCGWKKHTPFALSVPTRLKGLGAVEAYRRFYIEEKVLFARWLHCDPPDWWPFSTNRPPHGRLGAWRTTDERSTTASP